MRRQLPLWLFVIGLATFTVLGIVLGQFVKSPEQKQAEALPPEPTVTTIPVAETQLHQTFQLECTVADAQTNTLKIETSGEVKKTIVTKQGVSDGQALNIGSLVVELNGRPIFLFPGKMEFYRDLREGLEGPDVLQLQEGLIGLEYLNADNATGFFGSNTLVALQQFYADREYQLPTEPSGEVKQAAPADQNQTEASEKQVDNQRPILRPFLDTDELFVVNGVSARTSTGLPKIGTNITGGFISLGSGARVLKCAGSSPALPAGVTVGMPVEIDGLPTVKGLAVNSVTQPTITDATSTEPNKEAAPVKVESQVAVIDLPNEFAATRDKYSVTIVERSGPKDAAMVPASAVWTRGDQSFVTVTSRNDEGAPVDVPVEVVFSSGGECNIIGEIRIGEDVLIANQ